MAIQSSEDPRAFQSFEHRGWQTVGPGYQKHFNRLTEQIAPAMMKAAGVCAGMRVLDVCTGPGILASAAVARDADVRGIDLSSTMIDLARENAPKARFEEGDAQMLPFESESFDAVVCGLGIIHVPEPARALLQILRVLKSGGYAAISTCGRRIPRMDSAWCSRRSKNMEILTCLSLTALTCFNSVKRKPCDPRFRGQGSKPSKSRQQT